MKVAAFNSSPRRDGNTAVCCVTSLPSSRPRASRPKLVQLAGKRICGCTAC